MPHMIYYFVNLKELKICFSSFKWNDIVIITPPTLCCVLQMLRDKAEITHMREQEALRRAETSLNTSRRAAAVSTISIYHSTNSHSKAEGV